MDQKPKTNPEQESVIEYPLDFPIKVMGLNEEALVERLCEVVCKHDPSFEQASRLVVRESSGAKYLGLTFTVYAVSREQLDNLYRELTSHPLVKYVL